MGRKESNQTNKQNSCNVTMMEILHDFLSSSVVVLKINFFGKSFQEYHNCQTDWIQIGPDLGSNCLHWLSVEFTKKDVF